MAVKDNGAVDDYYSNLGSSSEAKDSPKVKMKIKLKPKKIVVKKRDDGKS